MVHSDTCASAHCGAEPITFRCNNAVADQTGLAQERNLSCQQRRTPNRNAGERDPGQPITGYGMTTHCIGAAPGVKAADNVIANNTCAPFEKR